MASRPCRVCANQASRDIRFFTPFLGEGAESPPEGSGKVWVGMKMASQLFQTADCAAHETEVEGIGRYGWQVRGMCAYDITH